MDIPQPSAALRRLEGFIGTFASREIVHPNEHMPGGGIADTICVGRQICNHFAVSIDYEQKIGGKVVYAGHGVFRHNATENIYELDWFDSMATNGTHFRGDFKGSALIMTSSQPNLMRLLYDFRLENVFRLVQHPSTKMQVSTCCLVRDIRSMLARHTMSNLASSKSTTRRHGWTWLRIP